VLGVDRSKDQVESIATTERPQTSFVGTLVQVRESEATPLVDHQVLVVLNHGVRKGRSSVHSQSLEDRDCIGRKLASPPQAHELCFVEPFE
jgi:hypothetical protein